MEQKLIDQILNYGSDLNVDPSKNQRIIAGLYPSYPSRKRVFYMGLVGAFDRYKYTDKIGYLYQILVVFFCLNLFIYNLMDLGYFGKLILAHSHEL